MSEVHLAIKLANVVLDDASRDPDSNLSMLSRQFLRSREELDRLRAEVAKLRALIQRCVDDDIDSGCFRKATYEACIAALEAPGPPGKKEMR